MSHAKASVLAGAALIGGLAACSAVASSNSLVAGGDVPNAKASEPDGGSNKNDTSPTTAGAINTPGGPTANGVMILHAAAFPSFRLCFGNTMKDVKPQPDATVMPEANVVGVEIGSLVRVDPLAQAPGKVYVINEKILRNYPNADCDTLINQQTIDANEYNLAGSIDQPLGVGHVHVLAITGCGSTGFLSVINDTNTTSCGADYDSGVGNLKANIATLEPTFATPTESEIPVQLFDMSAATTALNGTLAVTFGATGGATNKTLSLGNLFAGGNQEELDVDQRVDGGSEAVYAQLGFQVTATYGSSTVTVSQSLADVQQLSAPDEIPTTYYKTASNYALLVVGDPHHKATLGGGAPNPAYNPRRALHMLAVPVLDPSKIGADAGADASTP
jgi:hypothetical protein